MPEFRALLRGDTGTIWGLCKSIMENQLVYERRTEGFYKERGGNGERGETGRGRERERACWIIFLVMEKELLSCCRGYYRVQDPFLHSLLTGNKLGMVMQAVHQSQDIIRR